MKTYSYYLLKLSDCPCAEGVWLQVMLNGSPLPPGSQTLCGPNRSLRVILDLPLTAKWGEPEPKAEICHGR
jgi:hypothetical protein